MSNIGVSNGSPFKRLPKNTIKKTRRGTNSIKGYESEDGMENLNLNDRDTFNAANTLDNLQHMNDRYNIRRIMRERIRQQRRQEEEDREISSILLMMRGNPTIHQDSTGGSSLYKKAGTKVVLGKNKVIYTMKGSQKEYVKSKGVFIHISEYKKIKNKKK